MKKQNDIIKNLEAMAAKLGGEVEVMRYRYIKEAIVEVKFGSVSNLMVCIGPRGGIKYCSWFVIDRDGNWAVHHDEKSFTGIRKAKEVKKFFARVQPYAAREAA
jgi:hypothetical protein